MARGQKSFNHKNNTAPVSYDEIYMMVMLYTYQHKSLDYLARKLTSVILTPKKSSFPAVLGELAVNMKK